MTKKSPIKNLVSSVSGVHRTTLSQFIDSTYNAVQQGAQLSQQVVASSVANKRTPHKVKEARGGDDYLTWSNRPRRNDVETKNNHARTPPISSKSASHCGVGSASRVRVRDAIHMFDTVASTKKNTNEKTTSLSKNASVSKHQSPVRTHRHSPHQKDNGLIDANHVVATPVSGHNQHKQYSTSHYVEKENESHNTNYAEKDRKKTMKIKKKLLDHASPTKSNRRHPIAIDRTRMALDKLAVELSPSRQRSCLGREASPAKDDDDFVKPSKLCDNNMAGVQQDVCTQEDEDEKSTKKRKFPTRDDLKTCQHPLIQSPLRKHMKIVHESACANASCTMVKDPFPLLLVPPPLPHQPQVQQQITGGRDGHKISPGNHHLHTLDALAATDASTVRMREGNTEDDAKAMDLLATANFLFKNSRRKIG